jgi:hypothetical protein
MKFGDTVRVTHDGRSVTAMVLLVTKFNTPGMVSFDAVLGGYVNVMPILRLEDGSLVRPTSVYLTRIAQEHLCERHVQLIAARALLRSIRPSLSEALSVR